MKRRIIGVAAVATLLVTAACGAGTAQLGSSTVASSAALAPGGVAVASAVTSPSSPVAASGTSAPAESAESSPASPAAVSPDAGASSANAPEAGSTAQGNPPPSETASAGGDASLPVLIIHPYDGTPEYGVIRPASVASSGDGNNIIDQMVWTSWTATEAHATAIREVQSCNPSCADGTITPVPMTFDLSDPVDGHFTKVTETINGDVTVLTDEGFTPGNLGFIGVIMGPDSLKLPASNTTVVPVPLPPTNGLPVLIIYPDGGVPYAVIRPESIWGAVNSPKLTAIAWDHWTATEAVGTGMVQGKDASTGEIRTDQVTITLTNPDRGAFTTFALAPAVPGAAIRFAPPGDPHYRFSSPDSARVQTPCGC